MIWISSRNFLLQYDINDAIFLGLENLCSRKVDFTSSDLDFLSSSLSSARFISVERHVGNIKTNEEKTCIMTRHYGWCRLCYTQPISIPVRYMCSTYTTRNTEDNRENAVALRTFGEKWAFMAKITNSLDCGLKTWNSIETIFKRVKRMILKGEAWFGRWWRGTKKGKW
jgi:hypothetical protein